MRSVVWVTLRMGSNGMYRIGSFGKVPFSYGEVWNGSKGLSVFGSLVSGSVRKGSRGLVSDGLFCFVGVWIGS